MLDTLFEQVSSALVWLACAVAMAMGGRTEKIGAASIWLAWLASVLSQVRSGWVDPQYAWMVVDGLLFLALVVLALKGGRRWPMFAAACQALTLGVHGAMTLDLQIRSVAYLTAIAIWSLGVLLALVAGAVFEAAPERRARVSATL